MHRTILNVALLLLIVALLSLNWILRGDVATRNFDLLPNMVQSVPYSGWK